MPSIDEAVNALLVADRPILFLDTCILLDIIRSTQRELANYADRASELLRLAAAAPPACTIVVSSVVPQEWTKNARSVTEEALRHLRRMEEQSSHFHDACQALGIVTATPRTYYSHWGLAEALHGLSQSLLDTAIRLDADPESYARAVTRVLSRIPPASRNEVQDSAIIEEYLAVGRGLRAAGFARKRVVCTSNTKDYCEAGNQLHSNLVVEFAACTFFFTANLPWAVHEITH